MGIGHEGSKLAGESFRMTSRSLSSVCHISKTYGNSTQSFARKPLHQFPIDHHQTLKISATQRVSLRGSQEDLCC